MYIIICKITSILLLFFQRINRIDNFKYIDRILWQVEVRDFVSPAFSRAEKYSFQPRKWRFDQWGPLKKRKLTFCLSWIKHILPVIYFSNDYFILFLLKCETFSVVWRTKVVFPKHNDHFTIETRVKRK